jgi:hypothetical protein
MTDPGRDGSYREKEARLPIEDLGDSVDGKRPGKMSILIAHKKAGTLAGFCRGLLQECPHHEPALLRPDVREFEEKVESLRRSIASQVKDGRMNARTQAAIAEYGGFGLKGEQGRIWRQGDCEVFRDMLGRKPEFTGHADVEKTEENRFVCHRLSQPQQIDPLFASVTLQADQGNKAGIEVTGDSISLTVLDDVRRPLVQRSILLTHCTLEIDLGGARIAGGVKAVEDVIRRYLERRKLEHLRILVRGSEFQLRIKIFVGSGGIGIFRPETIDDHGIEAQAGYLFSLVGLRDGTLVEARLRCYSKDFHSHAPSKANNLAIGEEEMEEPGPEPFSRPDGRSLSGDARLLIMKRLWELANERITGGTHEPGSIIAAFDQRKYESSP